MTQEDFYTALEAEEAIRVMDVAQLMRVRRFANAANLVRTDLELSAEELLSEAIVLTLDGTRQWNKRLTIEQHLIGVMKSLASDQRRLASVVYEVNEANSSDCEVIVSALCSQRVDVQAHYQSSIEFLCKTFANDQFALYVLDGIGQQMEKKEIMVLKGMNSNEYDAARKRITRWIESSSFKEDVL